MFRSFKKGRPGAKPVSGKRDTQPARQKQTKEAGKARKAPRRLRRFRLPWWLSFRDWGMFPWWGRFFVILGVVAIGMAIWFAVQQFRAPPPTYHLSVAVNPMGSGRVGLSSSQDDYTEGTRVTLTASVLPDYEFVSWSGDASGTSPVVTVTMDSDKEVTANFVATVQEISCIMPTGISGSVVTYSNELERGEIVEGFVELTGQYYSQDWSFDWTFELIDPEGRNLDFWKGHWVEKNYHDFSFRAQYSGSYKIIVRHNSLYDKNLIIKISPMDWR